jgi:hypothetical protein
MNTLFCICFSYLKGGWLLLRHNWTAVCTEYPSTFRTQGLNFSQTTSLCICLFFSTLWIWLKKVLLFYSHFPGSNFSNPLNWLERHPAIINFRKLRSSFFARRYSLKVPFKNLLNRMCIFRIGLPDMAPS